MRLCRHFVAEGAGSPGGRCPNRNVAPKSRGRFVDSRARALLVHGPGRFGMVNNMNPHNTRFAVLGVSVLSLALLAGCAGLDDSDAQTTGKNKNPEAVLNAS